MELIESAPTLQLPKKKQKQCIANAKWTYHLIAHRGSKFGNGRLSCVFDHGDKLIFKVTKTHKALKFRDSSNTTHVLSISTRNGKFYANAIYGRRWHNAIAKSATISEFFITQKGRKKQECAIVRLLASFGLRHGCPVSPKVRSMTPKEYVSYLLFPATRQARDTLDLQLPTFHLIPLLRLDSMKSCIGAAFGSQGDATLKLGFEAVAQGRMASLEAAWLLKGLVPLDALRQVVRNSQFPETSLYYTNKRRSLVRRLLKEFSPKKLVSLFSCMYSPTYLLDSAMMYERLGQHAVVPHHARTIREVHEVLAEQLGRCKYTSVTLPVRLGDITAGLFTLRQPTNSDELRDWGNQMHNCIAAYTEDARAEKLALLGAFKAGTLQYCISIRSKSIEQFYGKRNTKPEERDYREISDALVKIGLVDSYLAWTSRYL